MVKISYITITEWDRSRFGYLLQAYKSLKAQTFKDFEWIIVSYVNDVIPPMDLISGDINIRFISRPDCTTPAKSWNVGISAADGEFIAFMDDDNVKLPKFGEIMLKNMEGFDALFCMAEFIDSISHLVGGHSVSTVDINRAWECDNFYYMEELMARKSFLDRLGGFDMNLDTGEDFELALRMMTVGTIGSVKEILCHIRKHGGNTSTRNTEEKVCMTVNDMHKILLNFKRLENNCYNCGKELGVARYPDSVIRFKSGWRRFCKNCANW
jgi:hypothetical protein